MDIFENLSGIPRSEQAALDAYARAVCRGCEIVRVVAVWPLVRVTAPAPGGSWLESFASPPGPPRGPTTPGPGDPPPPPSALLASPAMRAAATAAKRRVLSRSHLTRTKIYAAAQDHLRWNPRNRKT